MSPYLSARSYVSALLGSPDYERPRTDSPIVRLRPALARWGRCEGASLTLADGADDLVPTLHAERPNGDAREWRAIGDGTVRDACAWLGWPVPRTTLPGLAPVGYDGDGRLTAGDDGCGLVFADPTGDAPATRCAHRRLAPRFDPDAASALSAGAVRRRWPRDWGECPDCGEQVIVYASAEHFVAGDR